GVGGIGVGHRLHDDRRAAADQDVADLNLSGTAPVHGSVKRAMPDLVWGARSTARSLCSTCTCAGLPMTRVSGPRERTTRSAPFGLRDETSMRSFASFTSIQASSSQRMITRFEAPVSGVTTF